MPPRPDTLNRVYLALIALALPIPFFVKVGGAPLYLAQMLLFLGLSCRVLFFRRSGAPAAPLDQLLVWYLAWCFLSYLVNIPVIFVHFGPEKVLNQAVSLATMLLFMAPYYVGRYCEANDRNLAGFVRLLSFSCLLAFLYFIYNYLQLMPNMYEARELVGQRIPMVVALLSCLMFFTWLLGRPRHLWYLAVSCLGFFLVLLSLTRAAYIQVALSFAALTLYLVRKREPGLKPLALIFLVLLVLAALGYNAIVERFGLDPLVLLDRVQQIFDVSETTQSDESASVRVTIWVQLFNSLLEYPLGLLFGFGQLGPSYVGESFTSLHGMTIQSYSAHNQYLDTLLRSGLVGLVLELSIIFRIIADSFRPLPGEAGRFFKSAGLALSGVLLYGFFHETLRYHMFSTFFWFYAGLLTSRLAVDSQCPAQTTLPPQSGGYGEGNDDHRTIPAGPADSRLA